VPAAKPLTLQALEHSESSPLGKYGHILARIAIPVSALEQIGFIQGWPTDVSYAVETFRLGPSSQPTKE
jgi:hypothetical protein